MRLVWCSTAARRGRMEPTGHTANTSILENRPCPTDLRPPTTGCGCMADPAPTGICPAVTPSWCRAICLPTKPARHDAAVLSQCHRSEEHTSELQSLRHLVCRLLL